jgi:hypothetical protein
LCADNQDFKLNDQSDKTCNWVANKNTAKRCTFNGVKTNCRATCDPQCITPIPTSVPSSVPSAVQIIKQIGTDDPIPEDAVQILNGEITNVTIGKEETNYLDFVMNAIMHLIH